MEVHPNTPVLVGAGIISQREENAADAAEPIELMIAASRAAGHDAGATNLLEAIERILVPTGRWRYGDPGSMVGQAVGSPAAETVSAIPGVSQQTVLSDAATAIANGEITTALVVGGEAGYRLLRARVQGIELHDTENVGEPDLVLKPDDPVLPAYERDSGLGVMPVGYYALIDSAWRHAKNRDVGARRTAIAERYHRFSEIAAANPHGWDDDVHAAQAIDDAPMLAFPYTKRHVSNWSVDQASALLLTSVAEAERQGIERHRWIFPQAFTEANHMVDVTARGDLHRSIGAELGADALFEAAGCGPGDIDAAELYSCFPVAVDIYAEALGLSGEINMSVTGGMPFAGGPFNNFVLHATAQLVGRLRGAPARRGLVTTVSGMLTKQGFAIWGTNPNPNGYQLVDVTSETAAATDVRPVDPGHAGPAIVVGYTVIHDRDGPQRGVAVVDTRNDHRSIASTTDPVVMAAMAATEFCGRPVTIENGRFDLDAGS